MQAYHYSAKHELPSGQKEWTYGILTTDMGPAHPEFYTEVTTAISKRMEYPCFPQEVALVSLTPLT